jgi:hypothetical protein
MRIVDSTPTMSDTSKFLTSSAKSALYIPPNDLAWFFARRIGGQHEEPWLDILLGGPEAVGLNSEQRKAPDTARINLLPVEIERLFGAQFVHPKFKSSHCRLHAGSPVRKTSNAIKMHGTRNMMQKIRKKSQDAIYPSGAIIILNDKDTGS